MPTKFPVKITAKRQAPVGIDLRKLALLKHKIAANHPRLDLEKWRDTPKDYVHLRD